MVFFQKLLLLNKMILQLSISYDSLWQAIFFRFSAVDKSNNHILSFLRLNMFVELVWNYLAVLSEDDEKE